MKVKHFQYRIEFQLRGAGHVHGVLWLDLIDLDKDFPGIKRIFANIKANNRFTENELEILTMFIDRFISCSFMRTGVGWALGQAEVKGSSHRHV